MEGQDVFGLSGWMVCKYVLGGFTPIQHSLYLFQGTFDAVKYF